MLRSQCAQFQRPTIFQTIWAVRKTTITAKAIWIIIWVAHMDLKSKTLISKRKVLSQPSTKRTARLYRASDQLLVQPITKVQALSQASHQKIKSSPMALISSHLLTGIVRHKEAKTLAAIHSRLQQADQYLRCFQSVLLSIKSLRPWIRTTCLRLQTAKTSWKMPVTTGTKAWTLEEATTGKAKTTLSKRLKWMTTRHLQETIFRTLNLRLVTHVQMPIIVLRSNLFQSQVFWLKSSS